MVRTLIALVALASCVVIPAPEAQAGDISLLAGAGPRFNLNDGVDDEVNAIGVLHFSYELVNFYASLNLTAEFQSYLGGDGLPNEAIDFSDLQTGLMLAVPIGFFGIEGGASIGMQNLIEDRNDDARLIAMIKPEVAITATFAWFKGRISYQHNALPMGEKKLADVDDGQVLFMAGVVF